MREFQSDDPTFAVLKHNNACGLATRPTVLDAWTDALAGDPVSAFGGVLICNSPIDKATAEAMFDKEKNPMNLSKEELEAIKGEDGAIPGGLEPDEVFKLMNDPEVMAMVQKPKFQEIMADVMKGGGPMTLQKHMADPESREMLMTLTKLLQNAGMVPPGASR